jgi:nucleoside-diphosphate-sugar epimerase
MIVVSGGGSFLGMNIVKALVAKGEKVVLTTRRLNDERSQKIARESNGLATVEVLDLSNMYEVVNLFSRYDVKRVIHTATNHMYANTRAANYTSYEMLWNMLEAATSSGVERFVLCNSIVVYRGVDGPYREDQNLPPVFSAKTGSTFDIVPPFEVTLKRIMEAIALDYGVPMAMWDRAPHMGNKPRHKQMETVVLRFPAQVGPLYNSMYNPIANIVHGYVHKQPELLEKRPLRAFVDISYALDNRDAAVTVALAETLPNRIYNVSSGIRVTARQVVEAFYRQFPDARDVLKLDVDKMSDAPMNEYLDISRIEKDLGWKPSFNIDTMLADYVAWVRANEY